MCSPPPARATRRLGLAAAVLSAEAAAAVLSATAAAAEAAAETRCPAAGDLEAGIYVAYDDGSLSRFVGRGDGRVTEDAFFDDGFASGYRYVTAAGLYPLESYDLLDGAVDGASRIDTVYPGAGEFPAPVAGLSWRAEAEVRSLRDGIFRQAVTLVIGTPGEARYGACRYQVLPARLRFQDEVSDSEERLDFIPVLGIAIFRAGGVTGQDYDAHQPVAISPAPPAGLPTFAR